MTAILRHHHPESYLIVYEPKARHDSLDEELPDPLEFPARALIHIPEPNKHLVHFYGAYANRVLSTYRTRDRAAPNDAADATPPRRTLTKRWAELIYRIYEVDRLKIGPLVANLPCLPPSRYLRVTAGYPRSVVRDAIEVFVWQQIFELP